MELTVNLPDTLADEAKAAGLLTAEAIERLLREAVRRKAVNELFDAADRLAAANIPPMTMEEIQAEVDAVTARPGARVRVVLDTNIVVSGLLWKAAPRQVLDAARELRITLYTSSVLLDELAEVLFTSASCAHDYREPGKRRVPHATLRNADAGRRPRTNRAGGCPGYR